MLSDGYTDRLLVYESRGRRRARKRMKIKPLNKTYPSINLRALITIYTVVRCATEIRTALQAGSSSLGLLSRSSICASRTRAREANISLPAALQRRNKVVTFTAVPFVCGRQEICPGGRSSFCLRRPGATSTWPNCTISAQ